MLRNVVLGIAVVLALVAARLFYIGVWMPAVQLLVLAGLIYVGTVFENWRYRKGTGPATAQWQHTDEKFADPISGEEMEVQYDPASGERRYVRR
jgi:hypothetical protein